MLASVVVVEDHGALRELLEDALSSAGYEVLGSVGTVASGRAMIESRAPDLAVIDLRMPDGIGSSLIRELQAAGRAPRCVLYTASDDPTELREALDCGARAFVSKDGSLTEFLAGVAAAAAGDQYLDPRLQRLVARSGEASVETAPLTPREADVLACLARGLTTAAVAAELSIQPETVRGYVKSAMRKLEAQTRIQAVVRALQRHEIAADWD